jgi:hypothetical protein
MGGDKCANKKYKVEITLSFRPGGYKEMLSIFADNSALVVRVQMLGEGGCCGVSAIEYSCAHHVTWSPNNVGDLLYLHIKPMFSA